MFPYPSGAGLHVGHPKGYTATDVVARLQAHAGLQRAAPDGLGRVRPAGRARARCARTSTPRVITKRNIDTFRRQIKRLGFCYDWEREISTASPDYYKWTQWIFLKLFERGLAYLAEVPVNWCPALGTVLANEEVKDGTYVETGDPVERRMMQQWMLRITAYAERLLDDLDGLDWPDGVKEMQRNWIGKSVGAEITLRGRRSRRVVHGLHDAARHAVRRHLLRARARAPAGRAASRPSRSARAVQAYVREAAKRCRARAPAPTRRRPACSPAPSRCNPVTGKRLPIWIADYVLMSYGTGAIMAVPAHDERDHAFADAVRPADRRGRRPAAPCRCRKPPTPATARWSTREFLDGLDVDAAKARMIAWLEAHGKGAARVQYRLRDWLFSRQRYWGEPFPLVRLADGTRDAGPDRPAAGRAAADRRVPARPPTASRRWRAPATTG